MAEAAGIYDFDIIPPLRPVTIVLDVTPSELELAVATNGASLYSATMRAIVAAMIADTGTPDTPPAR